MAITAVARAKIVRRLLEEAERLKEWASQEGFVANDSLITFDLALTVIENGRKTVIKRKKKGKSKTLGTFLKKSDWQKILDTVTFSASDAPLALARFFMERKNRPATDRELDGLRYLKAAGGSFTPKELTYLNFLLREAALPYSCRSTGHGKREYRFFIVETTKEKPASNGRQLELFDAEQ